MLTRADFRTRFPEFQSAEDPLVDAFLAAAASRIDPVIWDNMTNEGHAYLTAHLMALAPNGQFARLKSDDGKTTYGSEYEKLREQVTCAIRVF